MPSPSIAKGTFTSARTSMADGSNASCTRGLAPRSREPIRRPQSSDEETPADVRRARAIPRGRSRFDLAKRLKGSGRAVSRNASIRLFGEGDSMLNVLRLRVPRSSSSRLNPTVGVSAVIAVCVLLASTLSAQLPPLSPAHLNPAIEKLASGKPIYGVLTQDISRENARALGRRDTDFVFIDMEHSPFNMDGISSFVAAMNDKAYTVKKGAQPRSALFVRMPPYASENAAWVVKQALDIGVMGFVFNTVETKEQAEAAVKS